MSGRIVTALSLIALLSLSACGGGDGSTTATGTTATTATTSTVETRTQFRVYFLLDGKVQPVLRDVLQTQAVARAALEQLVAGPTASERELGLESDAEGLRVDSVAVENGVASVELCCGGSSRGLMAQLVYTLTQFPTVKTVELGGTRYTRADFEEETPQILVESPLPFESVSSPIHAKGTANTFEATFQYEVVGPDGKVVDTHFVTATSGSGQRGTFDFTTRPFEVSQPGTGALVVYELSAKDGSRIHEVRIPVEFVGQRS